MGVLVSWLLRERAGSKPHLAMKITTSSFNRLLKYFPDRVNELGFESL